jgi:P-type Cu+ transporter
MTVSLSHGDGFVAQNLFQDAQVPAVHHPVRCERMLVMPTSARGSPAVSGVAPVPGTNETDLLAHAAAVEVNSEHPLAKAIGPR